MAFLSSMISFFRNPKPHHIFIFLTLLINPEIWLGPYQPIRFHDMFDSWLIALKTSFQNLLASGFPAWDPLSLCGNHALAQPFHPLHLFSILSGLFPLWLVYSIWNLCLFFIAGYGMYLYLHRILHIQSRTSLIGATFFFILSVWTNHSQVLNYAFPLFLYLFDTKMERPVSFGWKSLMLLFSILICAPFPLTFPHFPLFHLILILTLVKQERRKRYIIGYCLLWAGYILIHSPIIYALVSEAPTSHRSDYYSVHSYFYMSFLKMSKMMFTGLSLFHLIPLLFAGASIFLISHKKILIWWIYFILFFLVLVFFNSSAPDTLLKDFTLLKQFQWARLFYCTHFFIISILATYGLRYFKILSREKKNSLSYFTKTNFKLPLFILLVFILCLTLFTWHQNYLANYQAPIVRNAKLSTYIWLALMTSFIILSLFNNKLYNFIKRYSLVIICFLLLFFSIYEKYIYILSFEKEGSYNKFNQQEIQSLILSENSSSIYRAVSYCRRNTINECMSPSLITYHGLQIPTGYQTVYPLRYKQLWSKMLNPNYSNPACTKLFNKILSWGNRTLLPSCFETDFSSMNFNLLSLFNVKYILTTEPYEIKSDNKNIQLFISPSESQKRKNKIIKKLTKLSPPTPMWIYKNTLTLPRSFIVSNWEIFENKQSLLHRLEHKNTNEHLMSAVLFKSDLNNIHLPKPSKKLIWTSDIETYKPNFIKLNVSSSSEGILILTDTFHKNWRASLSNKPLETFPVNYIFRGVLIPKGNFQIEFKYQDGKLFFSYLLFFFGVFIFFLFHKLVRN